MELFSDLVLADWLIQTNRAQKITFHVKETPWFVSDTTVKDFSWLMTTCLKVFPTDSRGVKLLERYQQYRQDGRWVVTAHKFWTTTHSFFNIKENAADLWQDLCSSSLVIFKGDLNYRKLLGDCMWERDTEFSTALGPAWSLSEAPGLVALRTCKSEIITGLSKEAKIEDKDWLVNGSYGVIQFKP